MHTALALLLLLLLGPAAAQMSDPVECVGNASTVEHDVREVCCADGSVCRFWGHGEPEACTSACHEYFVPLYTQCSYLWSQRNMTLGTEPVEEAADRLDLSRLFTMCTTTGDEVRCRTWLQLRLNFL